MTSLASQEVWLTPCSCLRNCSQRVEDALTEPHDRQLRDRPLVPGFLNIFPVSWESSLQPPFPCLSWFLPSLIVGDGEPQSDKVLAGGRGGQNSGWVGHACFPVPHQCIP